MGHGFSSFVVVFGIYEPAAGQELIYLISNYFSEDRLRQVGWDVY